MTKIYFVRHAESVYHWAFGTREKPLTEEGINDCKEVTRILKQKQIDCFFSSPYKRSIDTIKEAAEMYGEIIITDERLRRRDNGPDGDDLDLLKKRWEDFNFCEESGETLASLQKRSIEALTEILMVHRNKNIVIGSHGSVIGSISNFYTKNYGVKDILKAVHYRPYILCLTFDGTNYISKEELLIIKKIQNHKKIPATLPV